MIEIVAADGYGAVTVRKLTRLAGVSSRSFYANFEEKEQCFLSTYEQLVRRTARRMARSQRPGQDWRQHLHQALRALTHDLAAEPSAAQLLLVESFAVGPPALARMSHAEAILEAVVRASLVEAPAEEAPPPFVARAIVAGATRVARERLLAGRVEELPEVADELTEWALSYACGAAASGDRRGRPAEPPMPLEDAELELEAARRVEQVRGDERALVLAAAAKLAASEGYAALSPARIRAAAGVSRRAFDAHFDGVEDCYLAAVEQLGTEAIADAVQQGAAAESWPSGLHRAVAALCERVGRDPALSRLAFLEGQPPGSGSMRRHQRLAALAQHLRATAPPQRRPSKLAAEASVGAAWDSIQRQVAAGRAARLPQQAERLTFLLLAPALGGTTATATIQA
jgi:AcrR family transcriptional regulator